MRERTGSARKLRATVAAVALLLTLPSAFACGPGPEYERSDAHTYLRMEFPSKADFISLLDRELAQAPNTGPSGSVAAQTPATGNTDTFAVEVEHALPDPADQAIVQKLKLTRGMMAADPYSRCGQRAAITANLDSIQAPAAALPLRDYLRAAFAFDCRDAAAPKPDFAELAHSGNAWVAEASTYMLGRQALVGAQRRWPDYKPPTAANGIDMSLLDDAHAAFAAYRKRYPHGRYVASSIGLERRILFLQGDQPHLDHALLRMLADVEAA